MILPSEPDSAVSGLKVTSVLRLPRLAVLDGALLTGSIGDIEMARLLQIRQRLGQWLAEDDQSE